MSNDEMTDTEHEASECLRRIVENDKRVEELKAIIADKTETERADMAELKATSKGLLAAAKKLAKEGRQMIAKKIA